MSQTVKLTAEELAVSYHLFSVSTFSTGIPRSLGDCEKFVVSQRGRNPDFTESYLSSTNYNPSPLSLRRGFILIHL